MTLWLMTMSQQHANRVTFVQKREFQESFCNVIIISSVSHLSEPGADKIKVKAGIPAGVVMNWKEQALMKCRSC